MAGDPVPRGMILFPRHTFYIQGGLFVGLIRKASMLVDHGQADVWVGHQNMHNVDFPRDIPRRWVHRVRTVPGVKRAEPYLIGFSEMTLPSGGFEGIVVVGVDPPALLGGPWNVAAERPDAILQNDGVIVDLEDSVAHSQKASARYVVRNVLRSVDFFGAERMVRINQLPLGLEDLAVIVPEQPDMILIPKVETADQVVTALTFAGAHTADWTSSDPMSCREPKAPRLGLFWRLAALGRDAGCPAVQPGPYS